MVTLWNNVVWTSFGGVAGTSWQRCSAMFCDVVTLPQHSSNLMATFMHGCQNIARRLRILAQIFVSYLPFVGVPVGGIIVTCHIVYSYLSHCLRLPTCVTCSSSTNLWMFNFKLSARARASTTCASMQSHIDIGVYFRIAVIYVCMINYMFSNITIMDHWWSV